MYEGLRSLCSMWFCMLLSISHLHSFCFCAVQRKQIFVGRCKTSGKYSVGKNKLKYTAMLNLKLSK